MGKVNVIIVDATGNKEQKVGLPDDIKTGVIMVKLVEKIKLPSVGPDGNPISYKFIHKVSGRQLLEMQTLAEAGPDGVALATLGKRVRGRFRTFKLRDLGYAQFRPYLADLEGVDVEQRDGQFYARLAR